MKKSLRFKVFERDSFICQYCGRRPPTVILHVDHIHPKSKGGSDDEINLITSCSECNLGKKTKIIKNPKSKEQIIEATDLAEETEEQIKKYYSFMKKKERRKTKELDKLSEYWSYLWNGRYSLNLRGQTSLKNFLSFISPEEIKESMEIAVSKIDNNPEQCFKYFCGVIYNKKRQQYGQN